MVGVYSGNRREIVEICSGVLRAGIIPVPINPLLTRPEVAYILEDCGAGLLFTDRAIEVPPTVTAVVTLGDAYERCLIDAGEVDISDVTLTRPMHYTSGTTGRPKGVYVPPASEDVAAEESVAFRELWGLDSSEVHLVCSPLAHSAPLRFSMRTLEAGGAVVVQERFEPLTTLAAIELFGITSAFMVPTHLERILHHERKELARHDLSTMRLLAHAGAPIREETKEAAMKLFPEGALWEFYGSTEGQATRISGAEWLQRRGSVGRALPHTDVTVADTAGTPLSPGEPGAIWIAAPGEPFVYWGDEEKTRRAWRDGAFTVGDLGWLDGDGYLYLTGRVNDVIITGGVNVYPQEVEAAIGSHPAVSEVMVYGTPSEEWGQEVCARVILHLDAKLDTDDLRMWIRERLAGYKTPRTIEFVRDLPRTATGKVKRPQPDL